MGQLEELYELILKDNNRLVNLLECINKTKSLTLLDVGGCDLDCLPRGMGRLDKFSHLDLSNNRTIVTLQKCIEKMKLLRCLDIGGCDLDCLVQGIM